MEYYGVHVALSTPFNADGSAVDHAKLAALVKDQIDNGIHGLIPGGSTGEFAALSVKERKAVTKTVVKAAKGWVPVTVGVGAMTTVEAVELASHAKTAGADAVLLLGPYYEEPSETEFQSHVAAVADAGLPVLLYNNPAGTGYSLSPRFVQRLARMKGVIAIKDTTYDAAHTEEIRELCGRRLQVLSGQDTLQLVGFSGGARAAVWGAPNAIPAACAELFRCVVERRDIAAGRRLWRKLYPVNRFFETEGYVAAVKAGAALRGIDLGPPRLPIKPLGDKPKGRLRKLMTVLGEIGS